MGFPAALLRRRRGASPLAIYAVLGRLPQLAFDFDGEKYFTGGSRSTFDDSITHSATTNVTMVDSDGVLKWRPHNLALNSASPATQSITVISGADYTVECTGVSIALSGAGSGTVTEGNPVEITASTTTLTLTVTGSTGTMWAYRSDLGGMVNNPDRGDSYVPTTSAARYLPRRGHHVYNGAEWVNEGLLHESEARTNLLVYSEMVDGTGWADSGSASTNLTDGALGVWDGVSIASGGAMFHRLNAASTVAVTSGDILTFRVWAKAGTSGNIRINFRDPATGNQSNLIGAFGSIAADATSIGTITSIEEEDWGGGIVAVSGTITVNFTGDLQFGVGPFSAVAGETVIAYAAQIEEGSTPSSYIPTSGSTVTRAAETLTIPAAKLPWPTPNVIGPELVTNGTFDTDLSGWTDASTGTGSATWVAGAVELTRIAALNTGFLYQDISCSVGDVFQISVERVSGSGTALRVGSTSGGNQLYDATLGGGITTIYITATTTTISIGLRGGADASTTTIDNISVREIDPLSVSIQMDGRVTYADLNENNQQLLYFWYKGANDNIQGNLETDAGTGDVEFIQAENNVYDIVQETSAYSPGVLVPYNIASRHGSTFVNGAVDGTEIGVNTTPVALPDLSTTDLSLGHDYMGTIRTFRMWNQDITDAGIEEASA